MAKLTAKTADVYTLYENSVQDPETEVRFLKRVYKKKYNKRPTSLREDFCGTGALACEWVKDSKKNSAMGVDLDPAPLKWGTEHHVASLGKSADRVRLVEADVLKPRDEKFDIVSANNFSYFCFKERDVLLSYFKTVLGSLNKTGFFYLDIYGGPEAQVPQLEEWEYDDYSYVWDQDYFDPVSGDYLCYIHFKFPDGSKIKKAFTYDWRLWNLMEVKDLLIEAGFSSTKVFWEGTDKDGDGNGVFRPVKKGDGAIAWLAYLVATP